MFFLPKSHKAVSDGEISSSADSVALFAAHKEQLTSQEPVFCKTGYLIDVSFQRMCSVVVEHAGEPDMDNHFRDAVRDAMEEMLHHRRECPRCSRHSIVQTSPEETKRDKDSSPADRSRQRSSGNYMVFAPEIPR